MLFVDTDIPAGNALITAVDGDRIFLRPDNRDSSRDWFYWHIRVRGCAGRRITLVFDRHCTMTVRGAAVSRDGGNSWEWVPEYTPYALELSYDCGAADELRFCLAMPYTLEHLENWLSRHGDSPFLQRHELCRTRQGRSVPWLSLGREPRSANTQVLLTARHHCCEMTASHVLEGVMSACLEEAQTLSGLRLLVVPLVDLDGVEQGDQGKDRRPHDHNRDYGVTPLYPETKAIQNLVRHETDERLRVALDLHCPYVVGDDCNHHIYLVGSESPVNGSRQKSFAACLEARASGPLPYKASDTLPFGEKWNTNTNYAAGTTCVRWVFHERAESVMAATLEIPYATAEGVPVTPESARAFGRDLFVAIREWVNSSGNVR